MFGAFRCNSFSYGSYRQLQGDFFDALDKLSGFHAFSSGPCQGFPVEASFLGWGFESAALAVFDVWQYLRFRDGFAIRNFSFNSLCLFRGGPSPKVCGFPSEFATLCFCQGPLKIRHKEQSFTRFVSGKARPKAKHEHLHLQLAAQSSQQAELV